MGKVIELTTANTKDYLTVEQAANILGLKETTVRNYLTNEKLTTYRFMGTTLLSKREVERKRK